MGLDTLSNVKDRLGIVASDDDTFLQNQIDLVSDVIQLYCGRVFPSTNWAQTFYRENLHYTSVLELYHFPIISLNSLVIDGVPLELSVVRVHKPTAIIKRTDGGFLFGDTVVIEYTAGYATIPTPILSVLDSIVGERYNKKKSGVDLNFGSDVQRISIPGAISIDFDYTLSSNERKSAYGSIIGTHANILDHWRSERAVFGSTKLSYTEEK